MKHLLAVTILSMCATTLVSADEFGSGRMPLNFIGGFIGPAIVTSTGGGNFLTYGGRIGIGLGGSSYGIPSLGVYVGTIGETQTVSGVTENGQLTSVMLEFVERRAFGTGLYFGARGGAAFESVSVQSGSTNLSATGVSFGFAPVLGYEIALSSAASIGIDLSWLTKTAGSVNFPGIGTINYNSAQAFIPAGTLNIQF